MPFSLINIFLRFVYDDVMFVFVHQQAHSLRIDWELIPSQIVVWFAVRTIQCCSVCVSSCQCLCEFSYCCLGLVASVRRSAKTISPFFRVCVVRWERKADSRDDFIHLLAALAEEVHCISYVHRKMYFHISSHQRQQQQQQHTHSSQFLFSILPSSDEYEFVCVCVWNFGAYHLRWTSKRPHNARHSIIFIQNRRKATFKYDRKTIERALYTIHNTHARCARVIYAPQNWNPKRDYTAEKWNIYYRKICYFCLFFLIHSSNKWIYQAIKYGV